MKRKLLSIALALCMVLGMMPTALATGTDWTGWTDVSQFVGSGVFDNGGRYYLSQNWNGTITMSTSPSAKGVIFDLNGKTFTGVITVAGDTELTIMDSSENGTGTVKQPKGYVGQPYAVKVDAGGTLTITGGYYTTGKASKDASVYVVDGTANISGGKFDGFMNRTSKGADVTCNMTGGSFKIDVSSYIEDKTNYAATYNETTRYYDVGPAKTTVTLTLTLKETWTYGETVSAEVAVNGAEDEDKTALKAGVTYSYKAKNAKDDTYIAGLPTDAGQYTVKASLGESEKYKAEPDTKEITITPALIEVKSVGHTTKVYNGKSAANLDTTELVFADDHNSSPLLRDTNAPQTERNKDWKTYSVTGVYVKSDKQTETANVDEAMYLKYTVTLDAGNSGNYAFKDGDGYTYTYTGYIKEGIKRRPVMIEGTVADKEYDGTTTIEEKPTNVTVSDKTFEDYEELIKEGNSGLVEGEALNVNDFDVESLEFGDAAVGTNKKVTVNGSYDLMSTSTGKAGNYYIYDTAITGNIIAKALTVDEVQLWGKSYDRTTTAEVLEVKFGGLADGEELEAGVDYTVAANYVDANVSESAKAAAWTLTLKQTDKTKNYTLGEEGTATGTIDNAGIIQKAQTNPIEITGSMAQPGGEGGIDIPLNLIVEGGTIVLNTTDTVDADGILDEVTFEKNYLHYTLENTAQEAQTATIILTVTSPNYETYNIEVTVGVPEKGRLYIESVGDTLATAEYTGAPITDFDNATFTFENENGEAVEVKPEEITIEYVGPTFEVTDEAPVTVGKYVAIVSVETDNYRGYEYFPFEIVAHELTVNVTANNKDYDGTTAATLGEATLVGAAEDDKVELDTSAVTAAFEDKEVGEGKKVVLTGEYKLTGEDAANYTVKQPTGLTADILPVSATDVKLDEVEDTTLKFDGQLQLKATLTPANATDTVTWSSSDEKVLKVSDKGLVTAVGYGTATITAKVGDKESKCTFTVVCTTEKTCLYYTDVPVDQWYHLSVDYVTAKGIMQGEGNKTFNPEVTLTRAELATILYNYEKKIVNGGVEPVRGEANTKFSDVEDGEWYEDAIKWAASHKIVLGDGEADGNTFRPDDSVSREEMVTMLHRYVVEYLKEDFSDVTATGDWTKFSDYKTVADWAQESFEWAVKYGIINGDDGNKLNPQNTATRAQAAKIMMVASELMK